MEFDMNTIQHLSISMYSTLHPVIAEIIANSWEADADEVKINLLDENVDNKKIKIEDNGCQRNFGSFIKIK